MRRDRKAEIVAEAVKAVTAAYPPAPTLNREGGNGSGYGQGNGQGTAAVGGESIQDADGNLYFMCGVSVCGGPDVVAP